MAVVKAQNVHLWGSTTDQEFKAVLVHGDDVGQVRELAAQIVRAHAGAEDDPFSVVVLDDASIIYRAAAAVGCP